MKVFIPADAPEPTDLDVDLEQLLDGVRLSELELLDELVDSAEMERLLNGEMSLNLVRPVLWIRLRREYPDIEIDGFDVEMVGEEPASGKG